MIVGLILKLLCGFDLRMIGRNKPSAYKRIITNAAIIKALIALIFI